MLLLPLSALAHAVDYDAFRAALALEAGWETLGTKAMEGGGVASVRHKVVGGQDCLEGSTTVNLPADVLLTVASDVANQPKWSSFSVSRAVRMTPGADDFDYYQLLENPFPIHDRYWFVHATVGRRGEDRVFTWQAVDARARYPAQVAALLADFPDAVETALNVGDWTFTPSTDATHIRYRICTDAGGSIPAWAGEYAARSTLPTNLSDLVAEAWRRVGR